MPEVTFPWWYPLRLRRLVCMFKGHRIVGGAMYRRNHAKVGVGCARCDFGSVREYHCQFPVPRL